MSKYYKMSAEPEEKQQGKYYDMNSPQEDKDSKFYKMNGDASDGSMKE